MSRVRGDVEDTVDPSLFQRVGVRFRVSTKASTAATLVAPQFATAIADEYQLYFILKTWCLVDILKGDATAAEKPNV